jgi:hypothetical protein
VVVTVHGPRPLDAMRLRARSRAGPIDPPP